MPDHREIKEGGCFAIQDRDHFGRTQKVPVALREARLDGFTPEEIAVVTEVLDALRSKNAKGISTLSHRFAGWELAKDGETIPYEVALVHFKKPRKKDAAKLLANRVEIATLRRKACKTMQISCTGTYRHPKFTEIVELLVPHAQEPRR